MVEIHESFNLPGARFVFSALGEKFPPFEKAWEAGLDHNHSFEEALKYIGNVGIMPVDHTLVKLSDNTKETIGFDLDNPASFESLIPKLPKTLTWETRPGRKAMIFKCKDKATRVKFGAKPDLAQFKLFDSHQVVTKLVAGKEHEVYRAVGEIKLERTYQIVPPSWKEVDGQRIDYILLDAIEPAEISLEWLLKQLAEIGIHTSEKINMVSRYARAALRKECEILATTPEGDRNTQLNKSAYAIGQIIGAGQLAEDVAHDAMYKVAIQIGLEPDEIERTLRSGLEAGKLEPREIKKSPDLREICITNRHLHEISGDAVQAIADAQEEDPRVYVRGAQLVRIKSDEDNNYKV